MKVIIIGSGLIGVSTAYFLSQQGHAVHVFDRREGSGMDTSFANGCMVTPSQSEPWNQPGILWKALSWLGREDSPFLVRPRVLFSIGRWGISFIRNSSRARFYANMIKNARLASYSLAVLRLLRNQQGLHYDENTSGTIKLFTDKTAFQEVLIRRPQYEDLGIACQVMSPGEVIELEPSLCKLQSSIIGGIYYPDDESGDAHKFCQALAMKAEQAGVKFHYLVDVTGFERCRNRINSITTSNGTHEADVFVLAAGSYSTLLARSVKLKLPVQPVKGYSLTFETDTCEAVPRLPIVDESAHIAVVPLGSRLRVAGTAELNGYNADVCPDRIQHMFSYVTRLFPSITDTVDRNSVKAWAGLRPYSSDGVPVLGETQFENLYLNTGHGHLGWSMAAGSGRLVSDIICGNQPGLEPEPYRLDR